MLCSPKKSSVRKSGTSVKQRCGALPDARSAVKVDVTWARTVVSGKARLRLAESVGTLGQSRSALKSAKKIAPAGHFAKTAKIPVTEPPQEQMGSCRSASNQEGSIAPGD